MAELGREPCPWRIIDDSGAAFFIGLVGGGGWHMLKGLKNSPKGAKMMGSLAQVRINAPRIGGSFGIWGAMFSVFDCSLAKVRHKEDPWNPIMAGTFTSGILAARSGVPAFLKGAGFGLVIMSAIEGLNIYLNKLAPPPTGEPNVFKN